MDISVICQILFANFKYFIKNIILKTILEILVFPYSSLKLYLNRKRIAWDLYQDFLFYFILYTVHTAIKRDKKYYYFY